MIEHWNNLSTRDRITASIGGICLISYLFYLLIYSPLTLAVATNTKNLKEKQETLAWMQAVQKNKPTGKTKKEVGASKLLAQFSSNLKKTTFTQFPYQLQQTSSGDIQLSFAEVPFNLFVNWLKETNEQYVIIIKSLNTSRTDKPGVVKLSVTMAAH